MLELFIDYFVVLAVVVDPIGLSAMFGALAHAEAPARRRQLALRASAIAAAVLVVFALGGDALLGALGVGMPAFQIAGGALLFLLAIDMVFARHSGLRATTAAEQREAETRKDISVFPLAVPLIAGPGALTSVLLMVGEQGGDPRVLVTVLLVIASVIALALAALLGTARIAALLGATGANVVSRVLGVVLAAMAVQFMLDGWVAAALPQADEAAEMLTI